MLGLRAVSDHVSIIRSSQGPLGIAGCHSYVIAAARALVVHRREAAAAAASSSQASTLSGANSAGAAAAVAPGVPAASSLLRSRRLAEFLYEAELRRSGRAEQAKSKVRRLLASLLFWMPLPQQLLTPAVSGEDGGAWVGAASPAPRPPGYGRLPRPVAGHERTALSQFQVCV